MSTRESKVMSSHHTAVADPSEVLGQPLAQRRRHQKHLLTITLDEVLGHHRIVFSGPDGAGFVRQPSRRAGVAG